MIESRSWRQSDVRIQERNFLHSVNVQLARTRWDLRACVLHSQKNKTKLQVTTSEMHARGCTKIRRETLWNFLFKEILVQDRFNSRHLATFVFSELDFTFYLWWCSIVLFVRRRVFLSLRVDGAEREAIGVIFFHRFGSFFFPWTGGAWLLDDRALNLNVWCALHTQPEMLGCSFPHSEEGSEKQDLD